ncbi:MAG: hypothetical protein ACKOBT_11520, partial [Actinomycetota bacterium]
SDEDAANAVSAKSSIAATVILKDGQLTAEMDGYPGALTSITIACANPSVIIFQNEDEGEHRMWSDTARPSRTWAGA